MQCTLACAKRRDHLLVNGHGLQARLWDAAKQQMVHAGAYEREHYPPDPYLPSTDWRTW